MTSCDASLEDEKSSRVTSGRLDWESCAVSTKALGRLLAAAIATLVLQIHFSPAVAQTQPLPPPPYVPCPEDRDLLVQIPEIVSQNGKLTGTMLLTNGQQRLFLGDLSPDGKTKWCLLQEVRQFRAPRSVAATYPGAPPQGYPAVVASPPLQYLDPVPGPTLRARVGDLVQLTFLNQINPGAGWRSIDRGERGEGCDQNRSAPYPGLDEFPDCFHGSSTGNIHFHGTHTTPSATGDNVFIEVRPTLRENGQLAVTEGSVKPAFDEFFKTCEIELNKSVLSQWPRTWADLPPAWTAEQEALLKRYDSDPKIVRKLWPVNQAQIQAGAWPQYYIGAYPFCYRLPSFGSAVQTASQPIHGAVQAVGTHTTAAHAPVAHTAVAREEGRALRMGQAPGTHWYHAHKHGSTTINVANGMTGAFIIEGAYDDALDAFYEEPGWTRRQPVIVINQLGTVPNLFAGQNANGVPPLSVNGRVQPKLTMRPGEVQLWRMVNTSSRSGVFFDGLYAEPLAQNPPQAADRAPFQWKQLAQDGVQFAQVNYDDSKEPSFLMAAGNRVDLLVKAPDVQAGQTQLFSVQVRQAVSRTETQPTLQTETLMFVEVSGQPVSGRQSLFIAPGLVGQAFPSFLADIKPDEVKATKVVTFESSPPPKKSPGNAPFTMHTIDGKRFDGNIGEVVLLNTVEEWKIENRTIAPAIDHPFHIHINPFQIVEVFDPNAALVDNKGQPLVGENGKKAVDSNGNPLPKYVLDTPTFPDLQCQLKLNDSTTWKDCKNKPESLGVWWDVFPIPAGRAEKPPAGGQPVVIPGYFKMRSRFVDYTGQYVIHCHILAHEDRGMMTIVQVVPYTTPYSHQ